MRSMMAFSTLVVVVVAVVWLAMRPTEPRPVERPIHEPAATRTAAPAAPTPAPPAPLPAEPAAPAPVKAHTRTKAPPPTPEGSTPPRPALEVPPAVRAPLPPVAVPTPTAVAPPPPPTVDRHAVKAAITAAKPGVTDCYQQALARNPELGGILKVQFTVTRQDGTGRIKDAEIADEGLGNPFFEMCVLTALGEMEYPAPEGEGEVVVTYPFKLQPTEGDD